MQLNGMGGHRAKAVLHHDHDLLASTRKSAQDAR
jgi:hypothetical protein